MKNVGEWLGLYDGYLTMKVYFNANNKATLEALERCGVRNVLLSHKYSYANIKKFRPKFESIFMVAGTNGNPEKYHDFLKNKMDETLKYLENERKDGIDWTLPVLQENYLQHLARLRPEPDSYLCLGEVHGKIETEDQIRKLPMNVKYHGLAKGKYIDRRFFKSLDTSGWISAAMSKKTEVWNVNSTYSMFFGKKGRGLIPMLRHSCEVYKDNLEKIGVKISDVIDGEYYALLKAPFALLYMPMLKYYGHYNDNFIN